MSVDRRVCIKKAVLWDDVSQIEICFVEGADGPDIFPVAVEYISADIPRLDGSGNNMLAKISQLVVEAIHQHFAVENVNAHRGLKQFLFRGVSDCSEQVRTHLHL